MVASVSTGIVAHVILPEGILVAQETARQVVVIPVTSVRQVGRVAEVDGVAVIPAVAGVITHWLPAGSDRPASSDGALGVVIAVVASVPHLLEVIDARRHSMLGTELHVGPCAVVH
jgi:hypothetical protein